jgi:hypothetical protein
MHRNYAEPVFDPASEYNQDGTDKSGDAKNHAMERADREVSGLCKKVNSVHDVHRDDQTVFRSTTGDHLLLFRGYITTITLTGAMQISPLAAWMGRERRRRPSHEADQIQLRMGSMEYPQECPSSFKVLFNQGLERQTALLKERYLAWVKDWLSTEVRLREEVCWQCFKHSVIWRRNVNC